MMIRRLWKMCLILTQLILWQFFTFCAAAATAGPEVFNGGNLRYVYTTVSPEIQESAILGVIQRLLPDRFTEFTLKVNPSLTNSIYEDAFELGYDSNTNKVVITGTTGVSSVFGLNFYLKYYCDAHISWDGNQLSLPNPLPRPKTLKKKIVDRFRYYQNVCTDSYSFVWYTWTQWEKEIDWMALNGINLPLAFTGQEAIWQKVYSKLGLTDEQIEEYISGPAFLAWWRMGNLQKWGGHIPDSFLQKKLLLLQQIVKRMKSLGMLPVLPAFAGHVAPALVDLYPNATYHVQPPSWNHFNSSYSATVFLDPRDPLFARIARSFLEELIAVVGTVHVYNLDAYNENRPSSNDTHFLRDVSNATMQSLLAVDSKAVWMVQGWTFTDFDFWTKDNVKAFLSGVEIGNLLILDLQAESRPLFIFFDSFFNHKFIWCMLHNFGGTMNLFGNIEVINKMLPAAREVAANGTLIGIGLAPEGIRQNYVIYDFMSEMSFRSDSIQTLKWITKYSARRYGLHSVFLEEAWEILLNGIYNNMIPGSTNHGHSILTHRPRLNATEEIWYNPEDISVVLAFFLVEGSSNSTVLKSTLYRHDLVDLTRQFCLHMGAIIYWRMIKAYYKENIQIFFQEGTVLLDLLNDLDLLLATGQNFLLGTWTAAAKSWGDNDQEKKLMRFNSLNQITTWGPNGEIVDYASKQWGGLVSDYLQPRWSLFIESLLDSMLSSQAFNQTEFNRRVLDEVEVPFTMSTKVYPTVPEGDSFEESMRIYKKWRPLYVASCRKWRGKEGWTRNNRPIMNLDRINLFETFGSLSKLKAMGDEGERGRFR